MTAIDACSFARTAAVVTASVPRVAGSGPQASGMPTQASSLTAQPLTVSHGLLGRGPSCPRTLS